MQAARTGLRPQGAAGGRRCERRTPRAMPEPGTRMRAAHSRNMKQPRARLQTGSSTRTTRTNFARASRRWTFTRGPATAGQHLCACVCRQCACPFVRALHRVLKLRARCSPRRRAARGFQGRASDREPSIQRVRPLSGGFNALSRRALLDRLTVWLVSLRRGRGLTCLWLGRLAFRLPFGLFSRHLRLERCKVGLHPCLKIEKVVVVSISC